MASRPRAGRGATGRDGGKDVDQPSEADILARIAEGLRKAKEHNDESRRLGQEIMEIEAEVQAQERTLEQHNRLDKLYRDNLKCAELEQKALSDYAVIDSIAILSAIKAADEPAPRNGTIGKGRKPQRPPAEVEPVVESPGPSPSDARVSILKRPKGNAQRSSSVASSRSAVAPKIEEAAETNKGVLAERQGLLINGTEVFYKYPEGSPDDQGEGIQCIIKKVWLDKTPIIYDVRDPEVDKDNKPIIHSAKAQQLVPIPKPGAALTTFPNGADVVARYPETDTFYKAKVRGFQKGKYTLRFEDEEDGKTMEVDKRFVLDSKWYE